MRKILLFCLLLLTGNVLFAQDYAPLPDTGIRRYFTNSAGYLRGIRVDSVVQETGYKRYVTFRSPHRKINFHSFDDSTGSCWVGNNVRAYSNGDWHFPNSHGDTIIIKTSALVNDTWALYNDASTRWFEARVTALDTQTVFGVLDSVKIITLTAKNGGGTLPADPITGFQIVLSKEHGFAQVPDLYFFPYLKLGLQSDYLYDYWFRKIDNGAQPIAHSKMVFRHIYNWNRKYSDIENFYPGDIFYTHYRYESGGYTQVNTYSHNKIVSKQIYPDSIAYTLDAFSVHNTQYNNGSYWGTGIPFKTESRLLRDTQFMPEEYIPLNSPVFYTHTYLKNTDKNFCSDSTLVINQERQGQGLYTDDVDWFQPEIIHYKIGLGVVYSYKKGGNQQFYSYDLLAYKRGGITCGVLPNSISVGSDSASFKLFPQPAGNTVFLEASNLRYPALIRIQNMQGQLLSTQQITAAGKPVSTAGMPAGVYLLLVTDASGNSAVQKLLIEAN